MGLEMLELRLWSDVKAKVFWSVFKVCVWEYSDHGFLGVQADI